MKKILLIDNDGQLTRFLGSFLGQQGFEIWIADDGEQGLALARAKVPDLVLCDLDMPGLHGLEVVDALRQEPGLATIPIILLTGLTGPGLQRQGMNIGADDFLTKPVDLKELVKAIQARLRRQEEQQKRLALATQVFAGTVHDLRDPLFVICGSTDLLEAIPSNPTPEAERAKTILKRMQKATKQMQEIITETLFLTKSRLHRLSFNPAPFDLREFIQQWVGGHEAGARLRFVCRQAKLVVVADGLCLRQLLENLVTNALKYSEGLVTIRLTTHKKYYELEIQDAGMGIPVSEQPFLFTPFYRASNVKLKPGHGLGLCVAKNCVELHGGTIRCRSEEGQGSTFAVQLPVSGQTRVKADTGSIPAAAKTAAPSSHPGARPAPPAAAPGLASPLPLRKKGGTHRAEAGFEKSTLLRGVIVDDDPLVRDLLRDLLKPQDGLLIQGEAGSVAEGRLLLKQHAPDVVFLDVMLPDGTGFDLLASLRPEASVVFISSAEEYAVHAFDCGALDYVLKPVSPERLSIAMNRFRERRQPATVSPPGLPSDLSKSFLIKTLTGKIRIQAHEIRRIVAYGEYAWVYWGQHQRVLLRKPLRIWEEQLPAAHFVRVHRHAIINLAFLERTEQLANGKLQIHMQDVTETVPVSTRLAGLFNRKWKSFHE